MYQLYYYPNNASLAPHFLLVEMELDFELLLVDRKVDGQKSKDYLKLNPAGRIPTLVDDDLVLFESPAICIYLCEQHSTKGLIPATGDPHRALFFQWLTFLNNTLQAELLVYYYPAKHTTDESAQKSIVAAQEERISDALAILDKELAGKQYLLGDKISACDFFLFMLALWSLRIKQSPTRFANLGPYLKRLTKRPSIVEVCAKEGIDLTVFG